MKRIFSLLLVLMLLSVPALGEDVKYTTDHTVFVVGALRDGSEIGVEVFYAFTSLYIPTEQDLDILTNATITTIRRDLLDMDVTLAKTNDFYSTINYNAWLTLNRMSKGLKLFAAGVTNVTDDPAYISLKKTEAFVKNYTLDEIKLSAIITWATENEIKLPEWLFDHKSK